MSFWESEAGTVMGTQDAAFAKSFKTIPDGSTALAKINSFTNASYNDDNFIQIDWLITDGDFAGKHVFQKIRVFERDEKKRLRALNMFKYLYQLFNMRPATDQAPTDHDLAAFVNKSAGIKIRETEANDQGKQYNWISEVHPAQGFQCETATTTVVTHVTKQSAQKLHWANPNPTSNDDVPF